MKGTMDDTDEFEAHDLDERRREEQRAVSEGGGGEAEGFELAEEDLIDIASHGDQHRFPDSATGGPEEEQQAEYGEPDEEIPPDE